jgi:hypothetical protein
VGSVEAPRVRATVTTRQLWLAGAHAGSAFATLDADLKTGKVSAEVAVETEREAVTLEGSFEADLPRQPQLQQRLLRATYAVDVNAEGDVQALARSFRDAPAPLGGRVSLALNARGRLASPRVTFRVESDRGGVTGATAGFDATGLVPAFMEGFARGVYIEGMVGRRGDAQAQDLGIGVQVEVALPRDFIASMSYGPGTTWSTDLYWSR